ncbi:MAG: DUF1573 domain-containing protein [Spirochaetes bacterium]|nr:DUF1573 domain-containing protein [Spirochaetota bacterium]
MNYKNIILYILFAFMFLIISCLGKPRIEFNELIHDFGDVKQNSELSHIFLFKNTGSSTLSIDKIKAG